MSKIKNSWLDQYAEPFERQQFGTTAGAEGVKCWCCRITLSRRSGRCQADRLTCGCMTESRMTSAATSWHSAASQTTSSCTTPDVNLLSTVSRYLVFLLLYVAIVLRGVARILLQEGHGRVVLGFRSSW